MCVTVAAKCVLFRIHPPPPVPCTPPLHPAARLSHHSKYRKPLALKMPHTHTHVRACCAILRTTILQCVASNKCREHLLNSQYRFAVFSSCSAHLSFDATHHRILQHSSSSRLAAGVAQQPRNKPGRCEGDANEKHRKAIAQHCMRRHTALRAAAFAARRFVRGIECQHIEQNRATPTAVLFVTTKAERGHKNHNDLVLDAHDLAGGGCGQVQYRREFEGIRCAAVFTRIAVKPAASRTRW